MEQEKQYCQYENCLRRDRALAAIGSRRKNGSNHSDWLDRKYHKKCWKHMQEDKEIARVKNGH